MVAPSTRDSEAPDHPSFLEALKVWARIGLLSFGGPAGQIALMHRTLVEEKRWISERRFLHALNYCMLLPGPEAMQLATYVGWLLHGTRGGIVAGALFVLPGFLCIVVLAATYAMFQSSDVLASLFFGLKAAILAIVVEAVLRIGKRALTTPFNRLVALFAFLALFAFSVPFPVVVLSAGLAGYIAARWRPDMIATKAPIGDESAVIQDGPEDRRGAGWARAGRILLIWGGLWAAPLLLILPLAGPANVWTSIMGFFSQMAVVSFGGAYAVLAYVAQQAVETYGWLAPGEMLDGLALAETTPGPLVLVLTYVGFLAAFREAGGLDPLLSGVLGAGLATWVTFIPCFLWIFLGAPHIERLRSSPALAGALATITAAVVGVILNLAIWFALHVIFAEVGTASFGPISMPLPALETLDPLALALGIIAAMTLFLYKLGLLPTLAICGGLGLLLGALGFI
ncbi:chromate efflux transporter [Arsenicitalea aurantiaca]|uniref:Chromate efflux transporter n=1 Tax=Arsenicitalea aurantiaca TaxID=1783274 RepID=A0A433XEE9_9HYPH|nr:chromate efflux transporter [Arsenicitalea aurantiaca]RUT32491.1 chromate efflux transporter [Arsenicitalea aurantiaca]